MGAGLKEQQMSFDCPSCSKPVPFTVNQVGSSVNCPHCNQLIHLDDNGITDAFDDAEKQLEELTNAIKELF